MEEQKHVITEHHVRSGTWLLPVYDRLIFVSDLPVPAICNAYCYFTPLAEVICIEVPSKRIEFNREDSLQVLFNKYD